MKAINQKATKVFESLACDLKELGDHKKIYNEPYMSLSIELIGKNPKVNFYSICVLDDISGEDVWANSYRLLKTHTKKVLFWDDREELKEVLA